MAPSLPSSFAATTLAAWLVLVLPMPGTSVLPASPLAPPAASSAGTMTLQQTAPLDIGRLPASAYGDWDNPSR